MSQVGLLGPCAVWRGLTKPRKDIMGNVGPARNDLAGQLDDLLPGQHPWSKDAGRRLKEKRDALGLSQPVLATKSGVSVGTISNLERGQTRPARGNLEAIAEALACPVAALLPLETERATAFQEGVAHALGLVEATLADLRRSLGPGGDGGFGLRAWLARRSDESGAKNEGLG